MNKKTIAKKTQQLDAELSIALGKLDQLDTSEVGIRECMKIFSEYSHEDFIKPIVGRLQQVFRNKHSTNLLKENVIIVIGIFASSFKEKSLPFIGNLIKCVMKNFDISRESLQQSCARSLKEIYQHALLRLPADQKEGLLFHPLLDYLLTTQGTGQSSCCLCLYEMLLYCVTQDLHLDFHLLAGKILAVVNVE